MTRERLSRRDFNRLSLAALGGAVAGTVLGGCGKQDAPTPPAQSAAPKPMPAPGAPQAAAAARIDEQLLLAEPHVCRGLNTCKGHGADGKNACAGHGTCATASKHGCHGHNDCKGQGGCEETAGMNDCKGQGNCGVPLSDETWTKTRAKFEAVMKAAGKSVGAAPKSAA